MALKISCTSAISSLVESLNRMVLPNGSKKRFEIFRRRVANTAQSTFCVFHEPCVSIESTDKFYFRLAD